MWFRKKAKDEGKLLFSWEECVGCGCLMREARKQVEVGYMNVPWGSTQSYCGRCAPPYDRLLGGNLGVPSRYYRREPSKEIEVTEKGKAIK